jgi:anaerobic magnesium-protoporphyrin IX monomethyl ester cyclase
MQDRWKAISERGHFLYSQTKSKMTDVALVQPRFVQDYTSSTQPISPPLGLAYLGATLKKAGFSVEAFDLAATPTKVHNEVEQILKSKPKIIGLSVTTPTLQEVYKITKELRLRGFNGRIILGGPHITARINAVSLLGGDFGLGGECENTFPTLCEIILRGDERDGETTGLAEFGLDQKQDETISYITDLDSLPLPERALFKNGRYQFVHLICSRGCPYHCTYCSMAGTPYRTRHPRLIVDELELIAREYPQSSIGFGDDVFTAKRTLTEGICKEIKARGLTILWSCTTRTDIVDRRLLEEMRKAGCWHISFGVETGVEAIRAALGKDIPNRQYEKIFGICKELSIKSRAYAMFGHPLETIRNMRETIAFIKKLAPDESFFSLTSIYPKTKLAQKAIAEGRITPDIWERIIPLKKSAPIYLPDNVTIEDMKAIIMEAVQEIYLSPHSIAKRFLKVRSLHELQNELHALYGFIADTPSI